MYRPNPLNAKLRDGAAVVGCWSHMASPIAAEILALAGYDFVVIDHEHGPGHYLDATAILHALGGKPVASILRVPWNDPVHLKRALDTGVDGVIVPHVNSGDEARRAVDACFYPPRGTRGMAHVICRASDYGMQAERYADELEDNLTVACMVETPAAVRNIGDIVSTEGLGMIFVGPFDLSTSMGIAGQFEHPEFRSMLTVIEDAARDSGTLMGTIATPADDVEALTARGYRFIVSSSDLLLLRDAAVADLSATGSA